MHHIKVTRLPKERRVTMADGTVSDIVTHYVVAKLRIGPHVEEAVFLVTKLTDETPMILGLPWLTTHTPSIDWDAMKVTFDSPRCVANCLPVGLRPCLRVAPRPRSRSSKLTSSELKRRTT